MSDREFRRGAVHWVDFSASRGGEAQKVRPAAIVSNDIANRYLNRVQVVPLTSNTSRIYPSEALVHLGGSVSKAMADQIATATKDRLGERLGMLTADGLQRVEAASRRQLGLAFL